MVIICAEFDISSSLEYCDGWTLSHFSKYVARNGGGMLIQHDE